MSRCRSLKVFIPWAIVLIFIAGCKDPKIISPSGDMTIDAGDSISFSAEAYSDAIYKWTFDGGAKDVYKQNPTVRFDRAGVYNVFLTVVFDDLESGLAALKVTVNDPSSQSYKLALNTYTAIRDTVDSKAVVWVVEKDGDVVMRRNAKNESEFTYFGNNTGEYKIWLERFYNEEYLVASNKVEYVVP